MSNEVILVIEAVAIFATVIAIHRIFKKVGMIVWVSLAVVLANVITAKNITIFGLTSTAGTVMFASAFLATDILTEYYTKEDAKTAVKIGLSANVIFIIASQIALLYNPSEFDFADGPMRTLFTLNLRISVSSMVMFFVANIADIYIFDLIKKKTDGKMLWLRNNVSTIICNCLENFIFMFFAFVGIYDLKTILIMAVSTSLIEIIVAVIDTPFLYLAKRSG